MAITCKFGGSSLADAGQILKVVSIISANPERRHIVVSAPGKRFSGDRKITDLLLAWHSVAHVNVSGDEIRKTIEDRYLGIVRDLGLNLDLSGALDGIAAALGRGATSEYAASRGEYLMGIIMSKLLGFGLIDPMTCIRIDKNGQPNALLTYDLTLQAVGRAGGAAVMPGFYGGNLDGSAVRTFSRGGSDISGAILARATSAQRYENWTDVDGMLAADPAVIKNPSRIPQLTYREARELSYMGFGVINPEALYPMQGMRRPVATHILNTNNTDGEGTKIIPDSEASTGPGQIVGIAGRKGFTAIHLDKPLMNQDVGFAYRALGALDRHGISFDLLPGSIDTIDIVVDQAQLVNGKLDTIAEEIQRDCKGAEFETYKDIALIAFVGNGMVHTKGSAARILAAIDQAGVSNRIINQGLNERNIIVGVEDADYEKTIRAGYQEFFGQP
jgi:aspartate kinase